MTRFARAKGSKSSNERVPDEPTPWHVMKQQLEDSVASKQSVEETKSKSAKELLQERDEPYYGDPGLLNHDWAEFETEKNKSKKNELKHSELEPEKKKSKNNELKNSTDTPVSKKKKKKSSESEVKENKFVDVSNNEENSLLIKPSKKKSSNDTDTATSKKKKKKEDKSSAPPEATSSDNSTVVNKNEEIQNTDKPAVKLSKRQKRNRKNKMKNSVGENPPEFKQENTNTPGTFNTEGNEWSADVNFGKKKLNKINNEENETRNDNNGENNFESSHVSTNPRENNFNQPPNRFGKQKVIKKRKPPKIRDDQEHKRRKPNPGSTKVIINGMEVEIIMYDGFPVKKEDADRLKHLKQQMVMKAIPKSEIDAAMKLERRKAEKALARIRKNVCFHCRKAGHNLSDCPDLGREEAATGICFKCGSGEHTHFECKVTKKEEFGFAKCFICKEQGHIAKQCPDNPKGLYPQGGACKICGDVTHLKKDCPDLMKDKEEKTLTVDTISNNAIETLESEKRKEEARKLKNKVIKF